jgi:hypothetical protein
MSEFGPKDVGNVETKSLGALFHELSNILVAVQLELDALGEPEVFGSADRDRFGKLTFRARENLGAKITTLANSSNVEQSNIATELLPLLEYNWRDEGDLKRIVEQFKTIRSKFLEQS